MEKDPSSKYIQIEENRVVIWIEETSCYWVTGSNNQTHLSLDNVVDTSEHVDRSKNGADDGQGFDINNNHITDKVPNN